MIAKTKPDACPKCGSTEAESVDVLHRCEHVTIRLMVCSRCGKEYIKAEYPTREGSR